MAGSNLDDLLKAIHNSLIEAQRISEQQHISQLARYFEEDGTPIVQTIKVPDTSPDAEEEYMDLKVPLISLIPPTALKIKNLAMKFKVGLRGFGTKEKPGSNETLGAASSSHEKPGSVEIDMGGISGSFFQPKNILADVEITFEGCEPAESFMRINDHLVKTIR